MSALQDVVPCCGLRVQEQTHGSAAVRPHDLGQITSRLHLRVPPVQGENGPTPSPAAKPGFHGTVHQGPHTVLILPTSAASIALMVYETVKARAACGPARPLLHRGLTKPVPVWRMATRVWRARALGSKGRAPTKLFHSQLLSHLATKMFLMR